MSLHGAKGLFLVALIGLTIPSPAHAQRDGRRGGPVAVLDQVQAALAEVNLTADQREKIDKIISGARSSARGMRGSLQDADPVTRRGMTRGFAMDLRDQVLAVLTPEQAAAFNEKFNSMAPTTQPAMGAVVERLYDFVIKLDLEDEQKPQIEKIFSDTRQKMSALRQNPPGDGTMPAKMQAMTQQLRQQLTGVLSEPQQQRLRQMIEEDGLNQPGRGGLRGAQAQTPPMMQDMPMQGAGAGVASVPKTESPPIPDWPGVQVGEEAPQFTLNNLDGRPVQFSTFKNKIVLLVFGSYSSPSFRQRAAAMEQLRRDYASRISVFVVYTRENYPVGQWEVDRNKDEGVAVEQPKDMAGRIAQARQAHTALKITAPMLIDGMDDKVTQDYGGLTNAAVLIGRDGKIVARQKWFEPYAMRRHIDEAVK